MGRTLPQRLVNKLQSVVAHFSNTAAASDASTKARVQIHLRPATGMIRWFLTRFGYAAITMPWRVVYTLPGQATTRLLRHEAKHLEQMDRAGTVVFLCKYFWWLARYGYYLNPYEVEARSAEND